MKPTIGILGGLGPEASGKFYEGLILKAQKAGVKSNTAYPHIILESIPAPEIFLENSSLKMYKKAVVNLEKAKADFIVMVCNSIHVFYKELQKLVKIPIINLTKEVEKELKKRKINSVLIIGTHKTMDQLFNFRNIKINKPSANDSKKIDEIILKYNAGQQKIRQRDSLLKIIRKYRGNKILAACTEVSAMLNNSKFEYIDTMDILLNSTFRKWKYFK